MNFADPGSFEAANLDNEIILERGMGIGRIGRNDINDF